MAKSDTFNMDQVMDQVNEIVAKAVQAALAAQAGDGASIGAKATRKTRKGRKALYQSSAASTAESLVKAGKAKATPKTPGLVNLPAKVKHEIDQFAAKLELAWSSGDKAGFVKLLTSNANRKLSSVEVLDIMHTHAPHVTTLMNTKKGKWIFIEGKAVPLGSPERALIQWLGFEKTGRAGRRFVHKVNTSGGRAFGASRMRPSDLDEV